MGEHTHPDDRTREHPVVRVGAEPVDMEPGHHGEHEAPDYDAEPDPVGATVAPVPAPEDPTDPPLPPDDGKTDEPVLNAATLAGAIAALILALGGLARLLGLFNGVDFQGVANEVSNFIFAAAGLWALVGPYIVARLRARPKVTPLSTPRDAQGRRVRLVPIDR